jgi:hypothetical protein
VNKKKQKNFDFLGARQRPGYNPLFNRSFLVLFFKKAPLA